MRAIALLFLLLAPQDPADKVRALVDKLGSEEIAEREAATAELVKLGPPALPAIFSHIAKASKAVDVALRKVVRRIERDERVAALTGRGPRVTLAAKDRPAEEVLAEITKQSGVKVDGRSLPAETRLTLEAADLPLAAAIDDLCKRHGGLTSQWTPTDVQIVAGSPRSLPSFDTGPFRFAVDRFEFRVDKAAKPPQTSGALRGGLIGPPGSYPDRAWIDMHYAKDDRGNDLGSSAGAGSSVFRSNNSFSFPLVPEGERIFQGLSWFPNPPPSPEATKVKKCKGTVRMNFIVDWKSLVALDDPTAGPVSKRTIGDVTFEIQSWTRAGQVLAVSYRVATATSEGPAWREGDFERPRPIVLEDKLGRRLAGRCSRERVAHRDDAAGRRWEIDGHTEFTLPEGFEIATLELLEAVETLNLSIPFELTDVPLR